MGQGGYTVQQVVTGVGSREVAVLVREVAPEFRGTVSALADPDELLMATRRE